MFEKKIESERTRWTDRERGKERGVEGAPELQIERDRYRDEKARGTERVRERKVERERFVARVIPERFSPVCLG